jgi:hypothetical protein
MLDVVLPLLVVDVLAEPEVVVGVPGVVVVAPGWVVLVVVGVVVDVVDVELVDVVVASIGPSICTLSIVTSPPPSRPPTLARRNLSSKSDPI